MFELKDRSLGARIGVLRTGHGKITTPAVLPVINPLSQTVPAAQLSEMGAQAVITNAYIIWKNMREEALSQGVHGLIGFQGPVMTDSGAYQMMEYGEVSVSNQDIIDFQHDMGVDIGVILDHPTASQSREEVKQSVMDTARAAEEASLPEGVLWAGPVQGTGFPDLQKECARRVSRIPFAVHPVGSIVPRMIEYDFKTVVRAVVTVRENVPADRPVHAFGAGHPMFFSLLVAAGADLFDSAAYALYAKDKRYLTVHGTMKADELTETPCSCPVCSSFSPKEIAEDPGLLSRHNLYVTFEEMKRIRQAIRDKTLFELLEERVRAHPKLLPAFKSLLRRKEYLEKNDWFPKKRVMELSSLTKSRPDVRLAKKRAERVRKTIKQSTVGLPVYGQVPYPVLDCYPFSQTVFQKDLEVSCPGRVGMEEKVRAASVYWFGIDIFPGGLKIDYSRKTKRVRAVYRNNELLATFRASDFYIILHSGARLLHERTRPPAFRVVLSDPEAVRYAAAGRTVFAKFVDSADPDIIPGQQVLVTDGEDNLLAAGTALLNAREMKEFSRGPAVLTRWSASRP